MRRLGALLALAYSLPAHAKGDRCMLLLDAPEVVAGVVPADAQLRQELDEPPHYAMRFLHRLPKRPDDNDEVRIGAFVLAPGQPRGTEADEKLKRATVTARHVAAIVDGQLQLGAVGGPLANARAIDGDQTSLDAVDDGDAGWLLSAARSVELSRIDGKHHLLAASKLQAGPATGARLVRAAGGALAAAWIAYPKTHDAATEVWLVWLDAAGKPRGAPQRIDAEVTAPEYTNLALVPAGDGLDLAWAPPVRDDQQPRGQVRLEVRAFHVAPGKPAVAWPRERALTGTWNVAGSAGGMMPIFLQGLRVGDGSAFLWVEIIDNHKLALRALVPGAPALTLGDETLQLGAIFARNVGAAAFLYGAEDRALKRFRLRCR